MVLAPYRLAGGLLVCSLFVLLSAPSLSQSVRHTSVFRTFLCCLLRYWLEIWYINLSWHNTDQIWVWSRLTFFYRSYCPLLKFCFPEFSQPSFDILTCNLVYEFVMTIIQIKSDFGHAWPTLTSYCPLLKFSFPDFYLLSFEILTQNLVDVYEFVMT